jgi:hypothetical protein
MQGYFVAQWLQSAVAAALAGVVVVRCVLVINCMHLRGTRPPLHAVAGLWRQLCAAGHGQHGVDGAHH